MRRRRRKPVQWVPGDAFGQIGSLVAIQAVATPVAQVLCGATVAAPQSNPPLVQRYTIERVVGDITYHLQPGIGPAVGDTFDLSLGIQVVDNAAAFPDPSFQGDADDDWMWLYHTRVMYSGTIATPFTFQGFSHGRIPVDIRTKRVIRADTNLLLVAILTNQQVTGANNSVAIVQYLRTLISRTA